jgi:hypothetical protein
MPSVYNMEGKVIVSNLLHPWMLVANAFGRLSLVVGDDQFRV